MSPVLTSAAASDGENTMCTGENAWPRSANEKRNLATSETSRRSRENPETGTERSGTRSLAAVSAICATTGL